MGAVTRYDRRLLYCPEAKVTFAITKIIGSFSRRALFQPDYPENRVRNHRLSLKVPLGTLWTPDYISVAVQSMRAWTTRFRDHAEMSFESLISE